VQSTVLYLWACETPPRIAIDAAIFADTGEEPQPVYDHLTWLEGLGGPQIFRASKGVRLSECLRTGMNSDGNRFVSIPAHLVEVGAGIFGPGTIRTRRGMQRRQCTREFKLEVIEQTIRRKLFGLPPGRPLRPCDSVTQLIGFSLDEQERALKRDKAPKVRGWHCRYPLIEAEWDRLDCRVYLAKRVPHRVMRSACTFCPFRTDAEWVELRERDRAGFQRAIALDDALRTDAIAKRAMDAEMYVHSSRLPLRQVLFGTDARMPSHPFYDCAGDCGT
jgi:hypothetical protein